MADIHRQCQLCDLVAKRGELVVVTTKGTEVCWSCVAEAVDLYKDMLKEEA